MARRGGDDGTGLARDAATTCVWIASNPPFQRPRRGLKLCLYCETAEVSSKRDRPVHEPDCLWRRATSLRSGAGSAEQVAIARAFASAGPWERTAKDGSRVCILCSGPSPMHSPSCAYWRLRVRMLAE